MAIGINLGEDSDDYDGPLFGRHYLEDEDLGFYGNPLDSKEAILTAIKQLSEKDKKWLIKQLKW